MTLRIMRAWPALAAVMLSGCGPTIVAGTTAVVTNTVVQERSAMDAFSDTDVELSIGTRLAQHSGELFGDVSVDVVEQRVVLTGSVPTAEDRIDAETIAWAVPGVRAVTNDLTVAEDSGFGTYWQDVEIANALRVALLTDGAIAKRNYNVTVAERVVHLTGIARSAGELNRVIGHARRVEGVERVVSHVLLVNDPRRFPSPPGAELTAKSTDAPL